MKTKTIKIYRFDELTKESKEVAIEYVQDHIDSWTMDDWYYFMFEDFVREVKRQGIMTDPKHIYFRGFWSQGDGASFEGSIDLIEYIKFHNLGNKYRKLLNFVKWYGGEGKINQSGHYVHEYTMSVDINLDRIDFEYDSKYTNEEIDQLCKQADELEKHLKETVIDLAKGLYKDLKREWEYITSDEYIAEELIRGEYEFLADGSRA